MGSDDGAANAGEGQQGRQRLDLEYAVVRPDAREVLEGDESIPTVSRPDHVSTVVGEGALKYALGDIDIVADPEGAELIRLSPASIANVGESTQ